MTVVMPATRERVIAEQNHRCCYCGEGFSDARPATMDHVVPRSLGGGSLYTNLVAACFRCNNMRGDEDA